MRDIHKEHYDYIEQIHLGYLFLPLLVWLIAIAGFIYMIFGENI